MIEISITPNVEVGIERGKEAAYVTVITTAVSLEEWNKYESGEWGPQQAFAERLGKLVKSHVHAHFDSQRKVDTSVNG
jgi:hypothetical protein